MEVPGEEEEMVLLTGDGGFRRTVPAASLFIKRGKVEIRPNGGDNSSLGSLVSTRVFPRVDFANWIELRGGGFCWHRRARSFGNGGQREEWLGWVASAGRERRAEGFARG